jgi:hypothetical protein
MLTRPVSTAKRGERRKRSGLETLETWSLETLETMQAIGNKSGNYSATGNYPGN